MADKHAEPNVLGRLQLVLVTYEKTVLEVECDKVTLPGRKGYFGVLPGHVALIASLKVGELMTASARSSTTWRSPAASAKWSTTW